MKVLWLCSAVATLSLPVAFLVNTTVPDPYMDEIFHIPQAQQYCKGNFKSWDPMITTPPGLYLVTFFYTSLLRFGRNCTEGVSFPSEVCSTFVLRSINIAFSLICAILFRQILLHLESESSHKVTFLKVFALTCYPLHWFFTFLYYTDVGSTTAVFAMYLASLKKSYWMSAMLGFVAILFRQTNVIWVIFVTCIGVIDFIYKQQVSRLSSGGGRPDMLGQKTQRKNLENLAHTENNFPNSEGFIREVLFLTQAAWQSRLILIRTFSPLLIPIITFIVFVCYNGGIVLGAKEAHKVSPHFTQVLYFGAAAMFAMLPVHLDFVLIRENAELLARTVQTRSINFLASILVGSLACVHYFSFAHPYLLADNRHYTFYIWRRVLNAHSSMKYLLVIMYIYSWCSIFNILGRKLTKIWLCIFFVAVVAVLVPAPLIEFRYYTIPFYFVALHTPTKHASYWILIIFLYTAINFATMYVFLRRPFFNPNESGVQRFIW